MILEALLLLVGSLASMPPQDIEMATLHVRVDGPDGKPIRSPNRELELRGHLADVLGRPAAVYPCRLDEGLGPGWISYSVPRGAEVSMTVWRPGLAVVHERCEIPLEGDPKRVRLDLGAPIEMGLLRLNVELPPDSPSFARGYGVTVLDGASGRCLESSTIEYAGKGLEVPLGECEVIVTGSLPAMCGNTPPPIEAFVPLRVRVRVGIEPTTVTLKPQVGCAIRLFVEDPVPGPKGVLHEETKWPTNWSRVMGCMHPPQDVDAVRGYLLPLEGEPISLTWRWSSVSFCTPWQSIPMETTTEQLVPVPPGAYTLVLTGPGIQEMRTPVLLSERWTDVRVHPAAR